MQSKLKELLDNYIDEYNAIKARYEELTVKCQLYKELISYFDETNIDLANNKVSISLLLNTIYNDDIYEREFYNLLYKLERGEYNNKNEIRSFLSTINKDYSRVAKEEDNLRNRINRIKHVVSSARRAKLSFKYNNPIDDTKYINGDLRRIINYYESSGEISNKEALLCINDLDFYNRNVITSKKSNKKEEEYASRIYNEIPNILNAGYEVIKEPEVDISRRASLNRIVEEITNTLRCTKKDKIIELLESYEKYELDNNEYNYVIIKVLNNFNEELISYYQLLLDKETYSKISNRREIIEDYYTELIKYLVVRDYYNKYNEVIIDEEDITLTDEEEKKLQEEKRLIFSTSLANPTKAKIIGDMDSVPYEYYDTVLELINNFISGKNASGELKHLKNNKKLVGFMELKYDQVRIVFKHIKNNIYNVVGVFAKKANNDMTMYQTMANRMIPDVTTEEKLNKQLELGEITLKQLTDLVEVKRRKGTR